MSYTLARATRLDLESFARAAGLHPDFVRRLVAAGVIDARRDSSGALWFSPAQLSTLARIQRLRAGFMLNYAALGLVVDLLDRIETLQALIARQPRTGDERWTPIS